MDTSLILRSLVDNCESIPNDKINALLESSEIVRNLTSDDSNKPLFNIWRLIALSEIPFTHRLDYTKKVINYVQTQLFTGTAYSLDQKDDSILPCYNAMIVRSLLRFGCMDNKIQKSIDWIMTYQPMNKKYINKWNGSGSTKYGGCYKDTPCFIGIVKSIKALTEYFKITKDINILERIKAGIEYILDHDVAYRISTGEPITKHILDVSFPESYNLNIVELLYLLKENNSIDNNGTIKAINYIIGKKIDNDYWKINYAYKADGYMCFDSKGQKGDWVTYILKDSLKGHA